MRWVFQPCYGSSIGGYITEQNFPILAKIKSGELRPLYAIVPELLGLSPGIPTLSYFRPDEETRKEMVEERSSPRAELPEAWSFVIMVTEAPAILFKEPSYCFHRYDDEDQSLEVWVGLENQARELLEQAHADRLQAEDQLSRRYVDALNSMSRSVPLISLVPQESFYKKG